ncbi:hypothetical protein AMELA_G00185290 [Ameiurus melas]|uniref:Uncharacterized protein n=1 Tax=Ameiurus melas TaxID=219545 RepID=A0A7J6A9R0_AMEME|nr:hypothetical protein AMELA_G00185290 [Ameiurus melas]
MSSNRGEQKSISTLRTFPQMNCRCTGVPNKVPGVMASKEVKEKLHRTVINRRSAKQAETQRETAHSVDLDSRHEQPNTPPSSQQRTSEFVLKHERRCSSIRKDPLNNSFRSSSNSPTHQCSPTSDQSDHTSQLWNYSAPPYYQFQVENNPSFTVPLAMWPPLTVPQQNMYMNAAMLPRTHILVHTGVCFSVRHHRPLERCQSQPVIHNHPPSRFDQRHSFREPVRPSPTHEMRLCVITHEQCHPEAEEGMAVQDEGKVRFMVGQEECEGCRLMYDPQMLMQHCICDPKHSGRIPLVFNRLQECRVSDQCKWFKGRECSREVVRVLHQNVSNSLNCLHPSVMMATSCAIELVLLVAQGQLRNGFAIVQPDSHDALNSSRSTSVATFSPVAIA